MTSTDAAGPAATSAALSSRLRRLDSRVTAVMSQYKDSRNAADPYLRLAGLAAYLVVMALRRAQTPTAAADQACPPAQ
ncbi:hypothetical protein E9529_07190 [Blastococcus sp. KM273128]|uniref:hypothetical protein n=1 Tax=Blastococcus sp. KM273128 TaxID=2570314 RepID=UPI001F2C0BE4|nr:hypothetical protein [Blastococcus sp. KM273128]MCF6744061.1 hypothetical protein [Blastococcus sp. KM273128]